MQPPLLLSPLFHEVVCKFQSALRSQKVKDGGLSGPLHHIIHNGTPTTTPVTPSDFTGWLLNCPNLPALQLLSVTVLSCSMAGALLGCLRPFSLSAPHSTLPLRSGLHSRPIPLRTRGKTSFSGTTHIYTRDTTSLFLSIISNAHFAFLKWNL